MLLERSAVPCDRPGETLHPGAEALFEQLGVAKAISEAGFQRHRGCHRVSADGDVYQAYGQDADGPWRGFQVQRSTLDRLLARKARNCGVQVRSGIGAQRVLINSAGRVTGVETAHRRHHARWLVDATGSAGWLKRQLGLTITRCSPQLTAWYGYVDGRPAYCDGDPRLIVEPNGWTWIAPLGNSISAWVRLVINQDRRRPATAPELLAGHPIRGAIRGADVTWKILDSLAGPGFFVAGDAASVLDPASSHGVLRALMTGILAGDSIAKVEQSIVTETSSFLGYEAWLRNTFESDLEALLSLYIEMDLYTDAWKRGSG